MKRVSDRICIVTGAAAGIGRACVARLADEIAQSLKQQDVITNLANQGAVAGEMSQQQFAQFVQSEHAKWTNVVKSSGAKAD